MPRAATKMVEVKKERPWRRVARVMGWSFVLAATAFGGYKTQQYVTADRQFRLTRDTRDALVITGAVHSSQGRIASVFQQDFGRSIFNIPLNERRRRLLAIDWVEEASISRIWPNKLVVHIRERQPVAFVNLLNKYGYAARMALIDKYGVLLDPPPQAKFTFPVLSGIYEEQTEGERRERVESMLRLLDEIGPLSANISEINAAAPDNLNIIAQVDGKALELQLGEQNYGRRFQRFMANYPEIKKRSPEVTVFDLRLDDRITAKEPPKEASNAR